MKTSSVATRLVVSLLMAIAFSVAIGAASAQERLHFSGDGFVFIEGQPRLVLGMYELPSDDAVLRQLADSGFNLVQAGADKAVLDRVAAHGLYAWIPLGGQLRIAEGDSAARDALQATVKAFMDHPALLAWEAPDEALWMEWFRAFDWLTAEQPQQLLGLMGKAKEAGKTDAEIAEYAAMLQKAVELSYRSMWEESEALYSKLWNELGDGCPHPERQLTACRQAADQLGNDLTRGWEAVWEIDQRHVFWQNHAPGNSIADMRHHNRAVHAAGCDIYPMPHNAGVRHGQLRDRDVTAVGGYTEIMDDSAPGKACWMVLQGLRLV